MDKSDVQAIVEQHLPFMLWDMQLNNWQVDVSFGPCHDEDDAGRTMAASCVAQPEYLNAQITIDPEYCSSEEDVLRNLRHELLHLFHAEFALYRKAVGAHFEFGSKEWWAVDAVYQHASERMVKMLEHMMDHGYRLPLGKRPDYKAPVVNPYEDGDA